MRIAHGVAWTRSVAVACVAALAALAAAAHASGAVAAATPASLEEVIVTAQRRSEDLQRVPVALTALSALDLQQRQLDTLSDLQYAAPNLAVWPVVGNSMTATISMRGQVEPDLLPTNDPAVATYLDGVYIGRMTGANLDLLDLERVEVLRGPQGTLYGRNALGGAISLISRKPLPKLEASLSASAGNFASREFRGMLNVPLSAERSALRIAASHVQHDGYGRAVLLGAELSDADTDYVRTQLRLWPAPGWTIDLAADLTSAHHSSQLITFNSAFGEANDIPAASGHPEDQLDNYRGNAADAIKDNRVGPFAARIWGVAATVGAELGIASLTSITAFRRLDLSIRDTDLDGTPYDLAAVISRDQSEYQFSQEVQLNIAGAGGRSRWTAGALYFSESGALFAHNANLVPLSPAENLTRGIAENESAALWLQLRQSLSSRFGVTAGVRYNVDWRRLISRNAALEDGQEVCQLDPSIVDAPGVCQATLPVHRFSYVPFTLGVDFAANDAEFLYAKVSRGYRAGGFNMRGGTPVDLLTFAPEHVTSYEIGSKTELRRRLRFDLSVFYSDFRDIQLGEDVPDPIQGTTFIKQNGGRARLIGGEAELIAYLGKLRVSGALGITDGKYLQLPPSAGIVLSTPLGLPKTTVSAAVDLPLNTAAGEVLLHADYAWHSDDGSPEFQARCRCHNAYGLLNALVTFTVRGTGLQLGLWGRNLTNTRYLAQSVDFDYLIDTIPGDPRTLGAQVSYVFGRR